MLPKEILKENKKEYNTHRHDFVYDKTKKIQNQQTEDGDTQRLEDFAKNLTDEQKKQALKQITFAKARNNYEDYLKLCYPDFVMTPFHKFLALICDTVVKRIERANQPNAKQEDIDKGRIRLLLSVPPRHGKTLTITNTLPSWFVGRNPRKNAILTAYNAELAEKFNNANRMKIKEFGKDVFGVEISETQDNKGLFQLTSGGSIMGVGVLGGITGNGGNLIIIDDPYKNSIEANSPSTRKAIFDTFSDSIYTRLQGSGNALIVIQTRWHEDDLCGVLSKREGWITINIPCVCDSKNDPLKRQIGETLTPELGFDAKWAIDTEQQVGKKVWEALYQGHPTIDGGEIFTRDMVRYYTKSTLPQVFDEIVMSCDLSFGGIKQSNDPCAIQVWGRLGANHYLLKRIKKRYTFNEMCNTIKLVSATFPLARKKIVEKKANGQAVIDSLNSVIGGFVAYDPKMVDKVGRANAITPYLTSGNVFLPDKTIDNSVDEMVEEMMKFPNGSHDDEVDAMTQYLNCYQYDNGGRVCTDNYYKQINNALRRIKV